MFKRARDVQVGDIVLDRGQTFTVRQVRVNRGTGAIIFIDVNNQIHGPFAEAEYLGVNLPREPLRGITLSTGRFAKLLDTAKTWDRRHAAMASAQSEFLLTSFCFSDRMCQYVDEETRRKWDVPLVAGRRLYTRCL
jgi:hypothetical protein